MLECDGSGHNMFQRFTDKARRTVVLAQEEARELGHHNIGTDHILLGLVREPDCRAAAILSGLGADQAAITQRILELRPAGPQRPRSARPEPRSFAEIRVKVESVLSRLTAVERFTGLAPDLSDMDAELGRLRREKDEAIDAQDFRLAEALSDAETELILDRNRRATDWLHRPSLAAEVAQLRVEVDRLRTILRTHGLDVDDIG